ncbi:MAG: methyltransferase domain-containing protein [Candidatus Eisenbacteria sp.]|nr:methyltransferase domain-containing protein [Candidatus Eisenbacteria bacterium]
MAKHKRDWRAGGTRRPSDVLRTELLNMTRGYTLSQAVLTANEIGLFNALAKGPLPIRGLARRLQCSLRGVRALADALTVLGLLDRTGEQVRIVEAARDLLVRGGEAYIGHLLQHQKHLYDRWARLAEAVRTGKPVGRASRRGASRERFLRAMIEGSRPSVSEVVTQLDLSGCGSLLDLGGGMGAYAVAFARRWPHLRVTLFDLPDVVTWAQCYFREEGMESRIGRIAGDARRDRLGGPYDAIFISNVLHIFSSREITSVLRRARRALNPGGIVAVKDFALRPDRRGPLRAGVFSLNMLVASEQGGVYTDDEYEEMMNRAGLEKTAQNEMREASVLLVARAR